MVTKAKTAVEPEAEVETETVDDAPVTKADVVEIVKGLLPTATEVDPVADTTDPLTSRQEEARTHNIVLEKIQELKTAFDEGKTKEPEKKEPETVPGPKAGGIKAWCEKNIWGIES
jgi:hypothetical protein